MSYRTQQEASGILRSRHYVLNPVTGNLERSTLLEKQLTQLVEFNVPGGSEASFETIPMTGQLAGEYAVQIEPGDQYSLPMPAVWNPNSFAMAAWLRPFFSSAEATIGSRVIASAYKDAVNHVVLYRDSFNQLIAYAMVAGTQYAVAVVQLPTFAADAPVFVGMRLIGNQLTVFADTDLDGTLNSTSVVGIPAFASAAGWSFLVGYHIGAPIGFNGGINAIVMDAGDGSQLTSRFNAGAGAHISTWLDEARTHLVLYVGGDTTTPRAYKYSAFDEYMTAAAEIGGYRTAGAPSYIDFGSLPLDGAAQFALCQEIEIGPGTLMSLFERGNLGTDGQIAILINMTDGSLLWHVPTAMADTGTYGVSAAGTFVATARYRVWFFYDGTQAAANRIKAWKATYDPTTRKFGAATPIPITIAGVVPVVLHGTTATNTRVGLLNGGTYQLNGIIYDQRAVVNFGSGFFDPATTYFDTPNEADWTLWSYWWPFDGDATYVLGGISGTVTGCVQTADGRHEIGRFETYERNGQFLLGGGANINLGDFTAMNGAAGFSAFGVFTPRDVVNGGQAIYSRFDNGGAKRQLAICVNATGIRVFLNALTIFGDTPAGILQAGVKYAIWVLYNGGTASLRIATAAFNPATGRYAAFTEHVVTMTGAVPAALNTFTGVNALFGTAVSGLNPFRGELDEWRFHATGTHLPATMNASTIYDPDAYLATIWTNVWHFVNNANAAVGAVNGTLSGTFSWYDGRRPIDLIWDSVVPDELDRATDSAKGTYSLRIKNQAAKAVVNTTNRLAWEAATIKRGTAGRAQVFFDGIGIEEAGAAFVRRASSAPDAGAAAFLTLRNVNAVDDAYFDDVEAAELPVVAPSLAAKGASFPALNGNGTPLGATKASITTAAAAGIPVPYVITGVSNILKLLTGPAGTLVRRYRFGAPWTLGGLSATAEYTFRARVFIKGAAAITPSHVMVRMVDSVGNTVGSALTLRGVWQDLRVTRTIAGGSTAAYVELQIEDGVAFGTADDEVYVALPTLVAGKNIPSYIVNTGEGTVTQPQDSLYMDTDVVALDAPFTIYTRHVEHGTVFFPSATLWHADGSSTAIAVFGTGAFYRAAFANGTPSGVTSDMAAVPALGDLVELRLVINASGVPQLYQSINGGPEEVGSTPAAPTGGLFTGGVPYRVWFNSGTSGANPGMVALQNFHMRQGVKTLAQMRAYSHAIALTP